MAKLPETMYITMGGGDIPENQYFTAYPEPDNLVYGGGRPVRVGTYKLVEVSDASAQVILNPRENK